MRPLCALLYLTWLVVVGARCQYGGQVKEQIPWQADDYAAYQQQHHHHHQQEEEEEVDERPKINLGIRLKIPAIKFELPRMNMPKITVSAKIRQPDRPRVISLPEINLDTHSSAATAGSRGPPARPRPAVAYGRAGGGGYGGNKAPHPPVQQEQEQTLTFSTQTETKPASHGQHELEVEEAPRSYLKSGRQVAAANLRPQGYNSYSHLSQFSVPAYASSQQYNQLATGFRSASTSDLGFDAPIYVQPKDSGQPIEAYGRRPARLMSSYMGGGGPSNFRHQNFLSAQEVFTDSRGSYFGGGGI